jgi:hypothetical protein
MNGREGRERESVIDKLREKRTRTGSDKVYLRL